MRAMKREKDVKASVKKLLSRHGWFWWCPPANGYGRSGISDFHAIRSGVFIAIETKFNNEPTALQQGFLSSVAAEAGFAFIVDEKRLDNFAAWMDLFDAAVAVAGKGGVPPAKIGGPLLDNQKLLMEGY